MEVWLWKKFDKKLNSTKIPTTEPTVKLDCKPTEDCTITAPVLKFGAWAEYFYCYIPKWGRYYNIVDTTLRDSAVWVRMTVDVLASFKSQILGSTQYVLRSASKYNGNIIDSAYPVKMGATTNYNFAPTFNYWGQTKPNPFTSELAKGVYIVGLLNPETDGVGAVTYYAFSQTNFNKLKQALMASTDWAGSRDMEITVELFKAMFNPFQYVVSVKWFPFSILELDKIIEPLNGVAYAWWPFPTIPCARLKATTFDIGLNWEIRNHPEAKTRGYYLNADPYTRTKIEWAAIGSIPIESALLTDDLKIYANLKIDLVTGTCACAFNTPASYNWVYQPMVDIGVNIQLSQITTDYFGAATKALNTLPAAAQTVGSAVAGSAGGVLGGTLGMLNGIGDVAQSLLPRLSSLNSNGSTVKFSTPPLLMQTFLYQTPMDNEHKGRPLCERTKLSELSGFTLCSEATADVTGTIGEKEQIVSYLNGGFYIE